MNVSLIYASPLSIGSIRVLFALALSLACNGLFAFNSDPDSIKSPYHINISPYDEDQVVNVPVDDGILAIQMPRTMSQCASCCGTFTSSIEIKPNINDSCGFSLYLTYSGFLTDVNSVKNCFTLRTDTSADGGLRVFNSSQAILLPPSAPETLSIKCVADRMTLNASTLKGTLRVRCDLDGTYLLNKKIRLREFVAFKCPDDNKECWMVDTPITNYNLGSITGTPLVQPICEGGQGGSITPPNSTGRIKYSLNWHNSQNRASIHYPAKFDNLLPGKYILIGTDPLNCERFRDTLDVVRNPKLYDFERIEAVPVTCATEPNGSLTAYFSASDSCTASWQDQNENVLGSLIGTGTPQIFALSNLAVGKYTFKISCPTDACPGYSIETPIVENLSVFSVEIDSIKHVSCYGVNNGYLSIKSTNLSLQSQVIFFRFLGERYPILLPLVLLIR